MSTQIEWCDEVLQPFVGCSKCSPGCQNCYAERFAHRLSKNPNAKISERYAGVVDAEGHWTGKINPVMEGSLYKASATRTRKRFFIGSMTDIFHENIPDEDIRQFFYAITIVPNCLPTYIVLTKRPQRAKEVLGDMLVTFPELKNVWLGVTVCNQEEADAKIPVLLSIPAAKRFVSVEPMLGAVDLDKKMQICEFTQANPLTGEWEYEHQPCPNGTHGGGIQCGMHYSLDWVICGGETGPGARPMHPDWVRSLRDQCQAAKVPFFFKGWGEYVPSHSEEFDTPHQGYIAFDMPRGQLPGPCNMSGCWGPEKLEAAGCAYVARVGKKRSGRLLDGREWNEVPV